MRPYDIPFALFTLSDTPTEEELQMILATDNPCKANGRAIIVERNILIRNRAFDKLERFRQIYFRKKKTVEEEMEEAMWDPAQWYDWDD